MLLKIYPENPAPRHINLIVETLKKGGVIIYPTDTVYAFGCDLNNQRAVERICQIKGLKPEKANFSLIVHDLSQLSEYTQQIDNNIFKIMKKAFPGPYTFILNANSNVPRIFKSKKKTIGIRIPDNNIPIFIVKELNSPFVTTSVHDADQIIDYTTDPEMIYERFKKQVDLVIDGGYGSNIPSTVIDCTSGSPEIIREGAGSAEDLF
jgi:tRNA threonylcarbamoyl adenosine modification protein (Sua5/YciO/YrdC/YwlC family)